MSDSESSSDVGSTSRPQRSSRGRYSRYTRAQKELFIKFFEDGKSVKEASSMANINLNTGKSMIRSNKSNNSELISKTRGGNRAKKLTEEVLAMIEACVERNPGVTLVEIKRLLFQQNNINISKSSIDRGLRELKVTLKLASFEVDRVNEPRTIELRKIYATDISRRCQESRQKMIFIDECGFNLHLRRKQARSRQNTRATVIIPTVRGRNVTLIAAMTSEKIVHTKIISQSTCNSNKFCIFLRELFDELDADWQGALLIMDNARIHKTNEVKETVEHGGYNLLYLPPYSPMLNPIEKTFSKMKAFARLRLGDISREHNLIDVIMESVTTISATDCSNYVMDMMMLLPSAVAGQELH